MSYHDEDVKFLIDGGVTPCKWTHACGNRWELWMLDHDGSPHSVQGCVAPIDTDDWSSMYIWEYYCTEEKRVRRSVCGTIWEGKALVEARLMKERSNVH